MSTSGVTSSGTTLAAIGSDTIAAPSPATVAAVASGRLGTKATSSITTIAAAPSTMIGKSATKCSAVNVIACPSLLRRRGRYAERFERRARRVEHGPGLKAEPDQHDDHRGRVRHLPSIEVHRADLAARPAVERALDQHERIDRRRDEPGRGDRGERGRDGP